MGNDEQAVIPAYNIKTAGGGVETEAETTKPH